MARVCALGGYPLVISLTASLILLAAMVVRGADYAFGDDPETARRLSTIEAAAPLWVWGTALLAFGVAGFVAIIIGSGRVLMLAHFGGLALYAALSTGIVTDVVERQDPNPLHVAIAAGVGLCVAALVVIILRARYSAEHWQVIALAVWLTIMVAGGSIALDGIRNATVLAAVALLHGTLGFGIAGKLQQAKIMREVHV